MSADAARDSLFGDAIASEDARPLSILPPLPEARQRAALARGEALMRALALVDEARADDDAEPGSDPAVRRLEAKVDLLVGLVGALMQRDQPADPVRPLDWSARGAAVSLGPDDTVPAVGDAVVLRLQPSDTLPEALLLPAHVLAIDSGPDGARAWLRFDPLPTGLEALLERHLFRLHRRAVAERRRQR
ncbi:PilZ domain-containing protein [Lysobacter sp. TY2-98]|uniref:PilZ domain-containing protein n=1 Tax=Lysobacter sp. TY2-98 TaxID=2290922 RepID=UPI000E204AEE|nr:PilZ domain-containing protein [Lysobacter sp. TY2-98]AXK71281.1 PilZ domain-containing protein [Lysobacter sp. TY2-98]